MFLTEVKIFRGGVQIPNNAVAYSTNPGGFAPIKKKGTLEDKQVCTFDLGIYDFDVVLIPHGIHNYFVDLESWEKHKDLCLDVIEENEVNGDGLLPTENINTIRELIRDEIMKYLLD
jgi:hypothetical protein